MAYRIVPRSDIGLAAPTNMSGSPRPQLARHRSGLTVHYVGAGSFRNTPAPEAVRSIEAYGRSPKKQTPFEYNYMIGQADDDLVYEYAGTCRAAHSRNNNADYFGVCLLNGVDEPPTDRQIDKVRWLRHWLTTEGWIGSGGVLLPHRRMPGQVGATACPGDRVVGRWAEFELPWAGGAPAPPDDGTQEAAEEQAPTPQAGGRHLVRDGETPQSIAALHYGDESRAGEIDAANDGALPGAGSRCAVPGVEGVTVTVQPGWGAYACIRAAGAKPNEATLEEFWRWNGGNMDAGERGALVAGEEVWVRTDLT